jgi:hypothetical protein
MCISGQKLENYEKMKKTNSSYKKIPHPLSMWQCTPANVELTTHLKAIENGF